MDYNQQLKKPIFRNPLNVPVHHLSEKIELQGGLNEVTVAPKHRPRIKTY